MKKTIWPIILVILAIAGIVALLKWKKPETAAPVDQNPLGTTDDSKFLVTHEPTMVSVAEDSYLLGIGGSYPQFSQADAAFNAKIAKIFVDEIASFKETANADYKAHLEIDGDEFKKQFEEGSPYTYEIKTNIVQSNDDYISAVVHYGGYVGGAHGYQNVITFNYDVKKKKELFITDFFPSLVFLASEVRQRLQMKFTADGDFDAGLKSMMYDGTDPVEPENFQNFTFTNEATVLYFSEYQVAPYVAGEQIIELKVDSMNGEGSI